MPEIDFYVGYQAEAAPSIRRIVRRVVLGIACLSIALAALVAAAQMPFGVGRFEFGQVRTYEGELAEWPYPMLLSEGSRYLLVGEGKFGVADRMRGLEGQRIRIRASLIERGPDKMLQIVAGSPEVLSGGSYSQAQRIELGSITLTGEIVDTKCHLGVMKPGEGKVHRACAVRCISGGAPPAFLVRDAAGETRLLLLTGADGRALGREVLDFVAEPVTIPGRLLRQGSALILQAEPRDFRRE